MISESIKQIIIRCDSSFRIGNGHTIRCRTLAREFKKAGYKVCFICRNRESNIIDNFKKNLLIKLPSFVKFKDISRKGFDLCDGLSTKRLLNLINSIN